MRILERQTLEEVTGGDGAPRAAGDLGFVRFESDYEPELLDAVLTAARNLRDRAQPKEERFLGLDHLRRVQDLIPEVAKLVYDPDRLDRLSEVAGVELEPYPISTSCSGVNFYWPGQEPIAFHCDGPAFVELVPLYADGSRQGGSTVVYRGAPDTGRARLRAGDRFTDAELLHIPQRTGHGVLFQGRMLLHTAETLTDGHRVTLVLSLRSAAEPWKDGNTLGRLLKDDRPEDVEDDWRSDVEQRQLPALRAHLMS